MTTLNQTEETLARQKPPGQYPQQEQYPPENIYLVSPIQYCHF